MSLFWLREGVNYGDELVGLLQAGSLQASPPKTQASQVAVNLNLMEYSTRCKFECRPAISCSTRLSLSPSCFEIVRQKARGEGPSGRK